MGDKHLLERWSVYTENPLLVFILQVPVTVREHMTDPVQELFKNILVWKLDNIIGAVGGELELRHRVSHIFFPKIFLSLRVEDGEY